MSFSQIDSDKVPNRGVLTSSSSPSSSSHPSFSTMVLRQFAGGTVGGSLLVLTGHPLDTIKTRMQAGEYKSMTEALRGVASGRVYASAASSSFSPSGAASATVDIVKVLPIHKRITTLYSGASLLVCLQGFYSATLFGLNGAVRYVVGPYIDHSNNNTSNNTTTTNSDKKPSLKTVFVSAVVSAPIHTALMTPMDVVKTRLQAMHKRGEYNGPVDCIKKMFVAAPPPTAAAEGGVGGTSASVFSSSAKQLFAGYGAYAAVRTMGFGPYFVSFEVVTKFLTTAKASPPTPTSTSTSLTDSEEGGKRGSSRGPLLAKDSPLVPLIGGSCAGVAYWCAVFPLDTVKTTLQLSRSPAWEGHLARYHHALRVKQAAAASTATAEAAAASGASASASACGSSSGSCKPSTCAPTTSATPMSKTLLFHQQHASACTYTSGAAMRSVTPSQAFAELPPMRYSEAVRYIATDGFRSAPAATVLGNCRLFYRGFSVAIVRAVPANAAMFFGVKQTELYMANNGW